MRASLDQERASLWPYSQALAASLALAELPNGSAYRDDVRDAVAGLARYEAGGIAYGSGPQPPYGTGGVPYYDDNEWVALDLLRAYDLLHDPVALTRARLLFGFVETG